MSIVLTLVPFKSGGLCYHFSLIASCYLMSKNKNKKLYFNDKDWIFKHTKGWNDYFESLDIWNGYIDDSYININVDCRVSMDIYKELNFSNHKFTLAEYKDAFSKILLLNSNLTTLMNKIMKDNNLQPGEYDAILIRRGDHMYYDSFYKETSVYLNKLVEKNTKVVFLQTDDYNSYLEMQDIIKLKNIDIKLICICPTWQRGVVHDKSYVNEFKNKSSEHLQNNKNKTYIHSWLQGNNKTTEELSPEEMKEHIESAIIGLEICILSRFLVIDFGSSNIARYLYIRHNNINNIISTDDLYPWQNNTEINIPCGNFC
jgi:hypothetical protein